MTFKSSSKVIHGQTTKFVDISRGLCSNGWAGWKLTPLLFLHDISLCHPFGILFIPSFTQPSLWPTNFRLSAYFFNFTILMREGLMIFVQVYSTLWALKTCLGRQVGGNN